VLEVAPLLAEGLELEPPVLPDPPPGPASTPGELPVEPPPEVEEIEEAEVAVEAEVAPGLVDEDELALGPVLEAVALLPPVLWLAWCPQPQQASTSVRIFHFMRPSSENPRR
jgi:hypothetical protein